MSSTETCWDVVGHIRAAGAVSRRTLAAHSKPENLVDAEARRDRRRERTNAAAARTREGLSASRRHGRMPGVRGEREALVNWNPQHAPAMNFIVAGLVALASPPLSSSCTCAAAVGTIGRTKPVIPAIRTRSIRRSVNSTTCGKLFDLCSTRELLPDGRLGSGHELHCMPRTVGASNLISSSCR